MESGNPISIRIQKLANYWMSFKLQEKARFCIWQIEYDEKPFIDRFYSLEETDKGKTFDLFISLTSPFNSTEEYDNLLTHEFATQLHNFNERVENEEDTIFWEPIIDDEKLEKKQFGETLLKNINGLRESLTEEFEEFLVVYLNPKSMKNISQFQEYLIMLAEMDISDKIRFMLTDDISEPFLDKLVQDFPEIAISIVPALDMKGAMQEIASAGDPTNPGVKFQRYFLELCNLAGKGKMKPALQFANKALLIAQKEGWIHLQIAVHIQVGSSWQSAKNTDKALESYEYACRIAENAYNAKDSMGAKLYIQSLFAKASAWISIPDYKKAMELYERSIPVSEEAEEYINLLEGYRMAGFCAECLKEYSHAWEQGQNALQAGKKLEEQIRHDFTLPYVGDMMLRLAKKVKKKDAVDNINLQMIELVGENWQQKLQ